MKNVPNHQPETVHWYWCVEILDHLTETSNAIPTHQIKAQTVDFHLGRYPRNAKTKYGGKNMGKSWKIISRSKLSNYQMI
jgi:hypothetical protein